MVASWRSFSTRSPPGRWRVLVVTCLTLFVLFLGVLQPLLFSKITIPVIPSTIEKEKLLTIQENGKILSTKATDGAVTTNDIASASSCVESAAYPLHKTNYTNDKWSNVSTFMTVQESFTTNNESAPMDSVLAVCRFLPQVPFAKHFPHAMLQLYRCWSWWRHQIQLHKSKGNNKALVVPLLHVPNPKIVLSNPFLNGTLHIFRQSSLRVEVMMTQEIPNATQHVIVAHAKLVQDGGLYHYAMASPLDAAALRQAASDAFGLPLTTTTSRPCQQPRISILDRQNSRHILNVNQLRESLEALRSPVQVKYFEGLPFVDQVSFMMQQTDILVSPHGAQLTSLPFLSHRCAAVVELFPTGYYEPVFFGSLAAAAGMDQHAYVYLGTNRTAEVAWGSRHVRARMQTRKANMCLPVQLVRQAVAQVVASWKKCCVAQEQAA